MAIQEKVFNLMKAIGYVQKKGNNNFQHYKYVAHADLMERVHEELVRLGIMAVPRYEVVSQGEKVTIVSCRLRLYDVEVADPDACVEVQSLGGGSDTGDKAVMKAMTASNKYAWMHLLAIATGDDPEADEETDKRFKDSNPPPRGPALAPGK
jgi:ERF superfamily